ncbi:ArdC family protein [Vibrio algicola]|uniref:ArdC family protein n=1 Tax=Vibrio algicola TaxID=2662262 RepID=UPI0015B5ABE2|nr:zincin-like metallopeptidase domain-containing protein [Vibrio algicola]
MPTTQKSTLDFHQEITNQIIEALEAGVKPWVCPWNTTRSTSLPYNGSTGKPYSGMNIMLLWTASSKRRFSSPTWFTFKQATALGGKVRKGEKGTRIFFYSKVEKKDEQTGEEKTYPVIKTYIVFNADQVDSISSESVLHHSREACDMPFDQFLKSTGADIVENGIKAFYRSSTDQIVLPFRDRFTNFVDFEATALHELTHWTGHKSRCDRKLGNVFGSKDYAQEELVAELGSAFLMAELGISGEVQHESYIANWLTALKNDKRYIFKAASMANKAYSYIMEQVVHSQMDKAA